MPEITVDGERAYQFSLPDSFLKLVHSVREQHTSQRVDTLSQKILALDPGETTGWATYLGGTITVSQQVTKNIGQSFNWLDAKLKAIDSYETSRKYSMIRCEDYKVYSWKSEDHSWASLHTPQLIGAIKVAAHINHTPISFMLAQQAKKWWTDEKLDVFGLNPKGLRHGRDALRHLLYYILFPNSGSPD